jgi:predicted porin
MNKTLVTALAVLAAGNSFAQSSVTLWGRMDMGYQHIDMGSATRSGIDNGAYGTSRFGIRGVEDLGDGLTARFALESSIAADNGQVGAGSTFFNRGSSVGLTSKTWGSIDLGRQYVPMFWPFLWADDSSRWRLSPYSAVQSVQRGSFTRINAAASPVKTAGSLDTISNGIYSVGISSAYEDNLVVYKTPTFNGFSGSVAYGMGAENASDNANKNDRKVQSANLELKKDWGYVGVGMNSKQGSVVSGETQKLTESLVSGMYKVSSSLNVYGNFHTWKLDSAQDLKGKDHMLGVSYWMPSSMVWLNYASKSLNNCNDCGSKGFGVGYHYFLSKRTEVYAQYGKTSNQSQSAVGLNGFNPSAPGQGVTGYSFGIAHSF